MLSALQRDAAVENLFAPIKWQWVAHHRGPVTGLVWCATMAGQPERCAYAVFAFCQSSITCHVMILAGWVTRFRLD